MDRRTFLATLAAGTAGAAGAVGRGAALTDFGMQVEGATSEGVEGLSTPDGQRGRGRATAGTAGTAVSGRARAAGTSLCARCAGEEILLRVADHGGVAAVAGRATGSTGAAVAGVAAPGHRVMMSVAAGMLWPVLCIGLVQLGVLAGLGQFAVRANRSAIAARR